MKPPSTSIPPADNSNGIVSTGAPSGSGSTSSTATASPASSSLTRSYNKSNGATSTSTMSISTTASASVSAGNCSFIKPSLSMTSLPPNNAQHDGTDLIKAKLRVERPYNSLKKKRNSDRDLWRHSWGSGHSHHSHSSCSLHSSVALSSGKDEFWAALQTNYNYIMDTNLLDSCREARCELEGGRSPFVATQDCCDKMHLQSSRNEGSAEDPRVLRKWLREMEEKLSRAPSLSEATQMSVAELQKRLTEHSVLYCEIVSHARVVGACIRASEKENHEATTTTTFDSTSGSSEEKPPSQNSVTSKRSTDGNLKGLEHRYHLLYLRAIEIQCLFEGLLGKKNSSSVLSRASSTDTDDEPASKLARLSDCEANIHVSCDLLGLEQTISDENKSEEEDEDWPDLSFNTIIPSSVNLHANVDFDADSEGSDCEIVIKDRQSALLSGLASSSTALAKSASSCSAPPFGNNRKENKSILSKISKRNGHGSVLSETNMDTHCFKSLNNPLEIKISDNKLQSINQKNFNCSQKLSSTSPSTATLTPSSVAGVIAAANCTIVGGVVKLSTPPSIGVNGVGIGVQVGSSVTAISTSTTKKSAKVTSPTSAKKRHRAVDISKFNRSNRKSKNCAIFYFKHLDTDNENFGGGGGGGGLSSQSDAMKSGEPSSDDEGWLYSSDHHHNKLNDDSDKENKEIGMNISVSSCSDIKMASSIGSLMNMDSISKDTVDSSTIFCEIGNSNDDEDRECSLKSASGSNHLKGEIDVETVTTTSSGNSKNPSEAKTAITKITNKENPPESIKQLVLDAEILVRDEVMKTPNSKRHSVTKMSSTVIKREIHMAGSNIKRVQEWLEHQPIGPKDANAPISSTTTDCEASGEYTESDSCARESDTSEGLTDSVATCMQTGSNSQCTSTEIIGGSAEPINANCGSNPNLICTKVIRRGNRRNSDRPWSVSCLSQLTESDAVISPHSDKMKVNQGLASHSISESALHILSSPGRRKDSPQTPVKSSDSKNSLKRRKTRRRRLAGKKSDSGSDGITPFDLPKITQSLIKSESRSEQISIIQDITMALSLLSLPKNHKPGEKSTSEMESEEENKLMKPNFKLGSYTPVFINNESKLGSLAGLANYIHDDHGEYHTGTEDHSSFSEQAWDNYQEKYNSENYSEGMDSDAARRLQEFGDDYRNFLDSQSDCCSSLSAANNFDSLSPPRMDSLKPVEQKLPQQPAVSTVDHIRRRRTLELEYERRRKPSDLKKKNSQDEINTMRSSIGGSSNSIQTTPKNADRSFNRSISDMAQRKLDFTNNNIAQSHPRKNSESDNSVRRRKSEDSLSRRRTSRTMDKSFKVIPPTSSSSNDDSDDEKEMKSLLAQSRNRLENTNALKIRSHLLRPEDYVEIIATCRDNIRCLESVLRGPPGTVLSTASCNDTRELLSSWESLKDWSENAAAARDMQEEMIVLRNAINRLGRKLCDFDSESSIQFAIEELKSQKTQLQTFRTNMLRLNASVHSWLTRQEAKMKKESILIATSADHNNTKMIDNCIQTSFIVEKGSQICTVAHSESEFHKHLKDEVSDMYRAWDEADARINNHLEVLTASLIAWRQLEYGLSEFHLVLGKDRGTLKGLEGALDRGQTTSLELALNVKQVAKLLSEKVDCSHQVNQATSSSDVNEINRIVSANFNAMITSSNGSLSDSGISDGGATSDGGLSERERRLGVLRRLAKQLENALAPGSDALKSIAARMEAAESELKTLQNTCRELIVRTAVSQRKKTQAVLSFADVAIPVKSSPKSKKTPASKRKNNKRVKAVTANGSAGGARNHKKTTKKIVVSSPDSGDPDDDPKDEILEINCSDDDIGAKDGWVRRVARIALPVQLALLTLFCAACLMEPHCCDNLNNLSMSFTPQLRYVRGPPPI